MNEYLFNIELTNFCNFFCKFCPHSVYKQNSDSGNIFSREKGFMSDKVYDLAIKNSWKHAKTITFGFFGEQLLHPRFMKLIDKIPEDRPYKLVLNTNWSLVTKEYFEIFKKFDTIKISLDSIRSETYDVLCPGGDVLDLDGKQSKNRCETLIQKMKTWFNIKDHSQTDIIFVTSSINENEISEFVDFWKPIVGVRDIIAVKSVLSYGGVVKDSYMSNNECEVISEKRITIAWNGDLTPCNLDVNIALNLGNIQEILDLDNLFGTDKWNEVFDNMKSKKGICSNCFDANNRNHRSLYESTRKK